MIISSEALVVGLGAYIGQSLGGAIVVAGAAGVVWTAIWPDNQEDWDWLLWPAVSACGASILALFACAVTSWPWPLSLIIVLCTGVCAFGGVAVALSVRGRRDSVAPEETTDDDDNEFFAQQAEEHSSHDQRREALQEAIRFARASALELAQGSPLKRELTHLMDRVLSAIRENVGDAARREFAIALEREIAVSSEKWTKHRAGLCATRFANLLEALQRAIDHNPYRFAEVNYDKIKRPEDFDDLF